LRTMVILFFFFIFFDHNTVSVLFDFSPTERIRMHESGKVTC
jgi:hypothetical protein